MNWDTIEFFDELLGDPDILGNRQPTPVLIGVYDGAITPWTSEDVMMLGRQVTDVRHKLLTQAPFSVIDSAKFIKINEQAYTIIPTKKATARWRVLHVKEYMI